VTRRSDGRSTTCRRACYMTTCSRCRRRVRRAVFGGAGLVRGYWRQPAATAARFVPNSFVADPGERLYRTGDLERLRANGNLEFVGRRDQQVKVRGYRVELAETEGVLQRHPAVKTVAVKPWPEPRGGARLVAYVVPHPSREPLDVRGSVKAISNRNCSTQRTASGRMNRNGGSLTRCFQRTAKRWISRMTAGRSSSGLRRCGRLSLAHRATPIADEMQHVLSLATIRLLTLVAAVSDHKRVHLNFHELLCEGWDRIFLENYEQGEECRAPGTPSR
jgi:acyl-CoA synthetase (AMP-forming)/AMP-acid ligase II